MKLWTEAEALQIVVDRLVDQQRWLDVRSMLRMAELALYRKKSICVRWRPSKRRHGDRRFKAAKRIIDAVMAREVAKLPAPVVLTGARFIDESEAGR